MSSQVRDPIAIIGAGVAGLTLAIFLQQEKIPFFVYDVRNEASSSAQGGAFTLFSNALGFLDKLGVYDRIKAQGCEFDDVRILNNRLESQDIIPTGSEETHGFKGCRILRSATVNAMKDLLKERGCGGCFRYNAKFSRVVEETENSVAFELSDGSQQRASLVIGADGIHSAVRKHISNVDSIYTGRLLILTSVPTKSLRIPEHQNDFRIPSYVQDVPGSLLLVHDTPDREDVFCMREVLYPEQGRQGWAQLEQDKDKLREILCQDKNAFIDVIQSIMEAATGDDIRTWPNMEVPELPSWSSPAGRVILIGDSAHATPPASMQGANQAMEDAYTLGLLLKLSDWSASPSVLRKWYAKRWSRIERIRLIGKLNTIRRMSSENRDEEEARLLAQNPGLIEPEMRWLLLPDLEKDMEEIVTADDATT